MSGYFTNQTFKFLADLKKHNDRAWFQSNKDRYEEHVKQPFLEFISDVGPQLRKISPHVVADPRPVGGSLFRIHRDVRFSRDKSPYKTHAGAQFRHAAGKDVHAPGYYLHIEPKEFFVAGGMWRPDAKALRMIRDSISDHPAKWKAVIKAVPVSDEESLVRPPQGFDPNHPMIEEIKRKSFTTGTRLTEVQVTSPRFMPDFIDFCKSASPLMRFLASAVGLPW